MMPLARRTFIRALSSAVVAAATSRAAVALPPRRPTPGDAVATRAERIVGEARETVYQHRDHIVVASGTYDCDCNGFVGFVLQTTAPAAFAAIAPEPGRSRPRAFVYERFFRDGTRSGATGWNRIGRIADLRRGDVIAWELPPIRPGTDTGHVMIAADAPAIGSTGEYKVRVFDSAARPHFRDTRASGRFPTGVGSGTIHFHADADGAPIAFRFSPHGRYVKAPIAIGRIRDTVPTA